MVEAIIIGKWDCTLGGTDVTMCVCASIFQDCGGVSGSAGLLWIATGPIGLAKVAAPCLFSARNLWFDIASVGLASLACGFLVGPVGLVNSVSMGGP